MNPQPPQPQKPLQPCESCGAPTREAWCAECRYWYGIEKRLQEYQAGIRDQRP